MYHIVIVCVSEIKKSVTKRFPRRPSLLIYISFLKNFEWTVKIKFLINLLLAQNNETLISFILPWRQA